MKKVSVFLITVFVYFTSWGQNAHSLLRDTSLITFEHFLYDSIFYGMQIHKDTTEQRILLIGDSMVGGLAYPMNAYCFYNGHKFLAVSWESANTKWFARTDTLQYFIKKFQPTFIFILLGANEVFYGKNYENKRGNDLKKIIQILDSVNIPYVWIGPPNWNYDTLINQVLRKYLGKDKFFATYKISLYNKRFRRWSDHIHPAFIGDSLIMDSLAYWISTKSLYPIKLTKPERSFLPPRKNLIILHPLSRKKRRRL